ncbi:VOC family protein [Humibacter sp.]|jgi:4a-hydroxytetrahydrobiopterin dehydratase|uniref:VOC family protein n=1 Tax=Humibacter sp. TaxID=1940291 RepID=UPI002BB4C780|nr:VOC family protein [Humibacter sp.]HVX08077.1 VOC family protein [Humibacter sp.]
MVEPITSRQFHEFPGVADWRVLSDGATAYFRTGSFAKGLEFVNRIGALADAADHHPDIGLRYSAVLVKLMTHEMMPNAWLSERDASLAARISEVAQELGIASDPGEVLTLQIAIDALDIPKVQAFWAAVLGRTATEEDLFDQNALAPNFWFQQMDAARPQRNRIHIDLYVPADQAEARIAAALAAGGSVVRDHGPEWWTLADPEGNEVDIAPWPDTWSGW